MKHIIIFILIATSSFSEQRPQDTCKMYETSFETSNGYGVWRWTTFCVEGYEYLRLGEVFTQKKVDGNVPKKCKCKKDRR